MNIDPVIERILNMDSKLGRHATAGDLDALSPETRRSRTKAASSHSDAAVAAIYAQVPALEELTGLKYDVDHIVPLAHGGTHCASNLQIVPREINRKKSDRIGVKYTDV